MSRLREAIDSNRRKTEFGSQNEAGTARTASAVIPGEVSAPVSPGKSILSQAIDSARRGEIVRPQSWQDYGGGYTPASTVPASGGAQNTMTAATGTKATPAPVGAAISATFGARIAPTAMQPPERQQDNNNLESLRQRAEELEKQYRQISEDAARSRYRKYERERAEAGELWRAARDEYEQALAEMGLAKPTFGERILKTLSGAAKQYLGSNWDAAGAVMPNGTAMGEVYQEQLESLYGEKQRTEEWLKQPEDEAERRQLENRLASINEQIAVYEASVRANEGVSAAARDAAAEITQSGAADLERAKFRATKAGQLLVDAGAAGAQMAGDAALGAMTGFGAMTPMMVRSFGGGTQQAREKGYSQKQQIAMGLASAATEYFSEKLFGGNPVYDSDAGLVSKLVGKITENETVLEYLASKPAEMLYEGLEEVTADLLEPLAEQIIAGRHDEITLEQVIEDGLVGIILAGVGQGGQKIVNTATQGISTRQTGNLFSDMTDIPAFEVSEADYRRAMQVTNLSLWSKDLKEIARAMGKTPAQTMKYFEEIVRNYNLSRYSSNAQAGQIYQQNVQAIDAEDGGGLLERAAGELASEGRVTNSTARDILENPTARATLETEAGLSVTEEMTRSQQRAAVKSAVESLASRANGADAAAPNNTIAQRNAAQTRPVAEQAHDALRIRRAGSALGESGEKALMAAYDGGVNADRFYAEFAAYYEAGVSGTDADKVKGLYSGQLNEAQKYAAYVAGQNDAAASLAAERENVKSAAVYGKEAGFIQTEESASLPRETVRRYDNVARAVGVKIQISPSTGEGGANGWYANGVIHIAQDAKNPGMVVAKHEITHRMQELAPEEYRKYRDYVMNAYAQRDGSTASMIEFYKSRYAGSGINLSAEQAMDEAAADFTEALATDPKQFERLARQNRSVAQKLLDAVREFVNKIKSVFKGKEAAQNRTLQDRAVTDTFGMDIDTLEKATQLWSEALEAAARQTKAVGKVKNAARTDDAARYSISEQFSRNIQEWYEEGQPEGERFILGSTGPVLQGLGAIESDIYMNGDKIRAILEQHPEMSIREIQRIPELLEDPVLVLKSKNTAKSQYGNSRLVMFGSVKAKDGRPVMCVLDLRPTERGFLLDDMQKVTSAYTKDTSPVNFIQRSEILHADKKRTVPLLRDVGFTRPASLQQNGSIGSISYNGKSVNLTGEKFPDVVKLEQEKTKSDAAIAKNPSLGTDRSTASGFKYSIGQNDENVKARFSLKRAYAGKALTEDSSIYSYHFLTELPDMQITMLPEVSAIKGANDKVDTSKAVASGMRNARNVGTERDGRVFVRNSYTGRQLQITGESIRHGLNGGLNRLLTNARLGAVIGNLAQNAVPINALNNKAEGVTGTYAMAAYATDSAGREFVAVLTVEQRTGRVVDMESYDMLHAVSGRQKRSERADTKSQGLYPSTNASVISIADLLTSVNNTHQSILSEDVLTHLGEEKNTSGYYTGQVKFSLKGSSDIQREVAVLQEENRLLKEKAEYWKSQTKVTKEWERTVRQGDVDKPARRLVKDYSSKLDVKDVSGRLKKLGEYLVRNGDGINELTWGEMRHRAADIARDVIDSAEILNDEQYRQYSDLRSYLRTTPLILGPEYQTDIADFNDFRKRNFGRLNLKIKGSTNIDQVYEEMSSTWPEFFDTQRETNPTDQLLHIVDVLDGLRPVYENPFSYDMNAAAEHVANDILDGLIGGDVRQATTRADRAVKQERDRRITQVQKLQAENAKGRQALEDLRAEKNERIEQLKRQSNERVRDAIARERARRDEQLQNLKNHYKEIRRRASDQKARDRLLRIAKRLQNKKLPAVNRALLDQYIGDLDTVAKSMTGKTLEKLSNLWEWYADRKVNDPDFIADPNIEKAIARLSKRHISDLSAGDVAALTDVLLNIENELRTERKLIDSEDCRDTYHMGEEVIRDVYATSGSRGGALDRFIVTETLSPLREVRRLTGYVDADPLLRLTQELANGQLRMLDYQMKAEKAAQPFAEDKEFSRMFSGPKADGIEITGMTKDGPATVTITPAMRTSLYLHSLNDQNLKHINDGGITVPDEKLYRKGKLAEAYNRGTTVRLTPTQVRAICGGMTEREKAFARMAHDYFNKRSRTAINEVSEKLKGYSIAQVENYFPINTDTSFTRSDFDTVKFDGSIEGMGFLKDRRNAANPILLRDVNMVLEQSIQQHAKYYGLAIPIRNFNKVWGVSKSSFVMNEDGSYACDEDGNYVRNGYDSSVQQAVKKQWGETGYGYIEKMMTDLQSPRPPKDVWAKALGKIRSNYAGAVLTLNASVAMKQAASYPTAAAVLGWRPLIAAFKDFGRVDLDLIAKYTPLQWYRSKGFSTKELGDLRQTGGPIAKVMNNLPTVLNWVQGADLITTRKLWKASEYYVRQHSPGLARGSEVYYRAVADIYNRVIEETQPNYTTMQRPQLLRSDDSLMSNLAMFKTQPFQNFNILYAAAANLDAKSRQAKNGGSKEALKEARTNFSRAVTSQLAQLAVFAGMTMAWSMFRGKDDKYKDDETGELTLLSVLEALSKDMAGGLLSGVPFGSDAWEFASSKFFGDKYYGLDAVTVTALTNTISSLFGMAELIGNGVKSVATGKEVDWNAARLEADGYIDDISKGAGIPFENVANLFNAVARRVCITVNGKYLGEYQSLKLTTDPDKYSKDYYDLLYGTSKNDREAYEAMYADMVENWGFDADKVKTAMETRMKKEQGVEHSSDLERRYLSPEQESAWDDAYGTISESQAWSAASDEQRKAAADDLYDLIVGNSTGAAMQEKIVGGAAYCIDEADYVLYRLALRIADKPNDSGNLGTYTNDEVAAAIDMLPGLSNEARSYLWEAQGKSEKNNPYK